MEQTIEEMLNEIVGIDEPTPEIHEKLGEALIKVVDMVCHLTIDQLAEAVYQYNQWLINE